MHAPWKESYGKPSQCIEKQRHHFADKYVSSQRYVFPGVMYRCESRTLKKTEHWRTDAFKLWCWRRLLRIPWTARRSNESISRKSVLNIHWKDWRWNSNTLATWCEEPTHWDRFWCWESLMAKGEEEDDRGQDGWMALPTQWAWVWASSRRSWRTEEPGTLPSMESQRVGHGLATEQQQQQRQSPSPLAGRLMPSIVLSQLHLQTSFYPLWKAALLFNLLDSLRNTPAPQFTAC